MKEQKLQNQGSHQDLPQEAAQEAAGWSCLLPGCKGICGAGLKWLAAALMILDHVCMLLPDGVPGWVSMWGQLAFPLYAFLLAEGALHTRSKGRYALRLAIFAALSEVPHDLFTDGVVIEWVGQNVFMTLLLGLLAIWAMEATRAPGMQWLGIVAAIGIWAFSPYAMAEYAETGVLCILCMYFAHRVQKPELRLLIMGLGILQMGVMGLLFTGSIYHCAGLLALVPISLYNGNRGRQGNKWVWYGLYPAQLLLLYGAEVLLIG